MTRVLTLRVAAVSVFVVSLAVVGHVPVGARGNATFSQIVTFGTSLSDSGNAFVLLDEQNGPPDYHVDQLLLPFSPYRRGGHHLTNGPTWIEQFARSVGLAASGHPAFRDQGRFAANYAVGGARAYDDQQNFNLSSQVASFLSDANGQADPGALYVIEMGTNDVRDALVAFAQQPQQATAIVQAGVASVAQSIMTLHAAGARSFLVWSVPDLAVTPAVRALDAQFPGTAFVAGLLTQGFNAGLSGALAQLAPLPGLQVARLDAYSLTHDVVADPGSYGLTNVTTPCISPGVAPFVCQQPSEYFFWDGIHPTTAAHGILALAAEDALY